MKLKCYKGQFLYEFTQDFEKQIKIGSFFICLVVATEILILIHTNFTYF